MKNGNYIMYQTTYGTFSSTPSALKRTTIPENEEPVLRDMTKQTRDLAEASIAAKREREEAQKKAAQKAEAKTTSAPAARASRS